MIYRYLCLIFCTILAIGWNSGNTFFARDIVNQKGEASLALIEKIINNSDYSSGREVLKYFTPKYKSENERLEFKLDLLYSSSIFLPLWSAKDYDDSIKIIEKLQQCSYKPAKMYLYEAQYYKNKGEWSIANQLVRHALSLMRTGGSLPHKQGFLTARALLLDGIINGNQDTITQAIDQMEIVANQNPDNILYLYTLIEMFDYIDVPSELYNTYEERIVLYKKKYEELKNELLLNNQNNLIYLKEKQDNYYFEKVKKPLIEEILRKWKKVHKVQIVPAELMYVFQLNKNRTISNIKLLAQQDASLKLKSISELSISDAIVPYIPEEYPLETMEILFIFTYNR